MGAVAAASARKRAVEASWCPMAMLAVWICEQEIGSCLTLRNLNVAVCWQQIFYLVASTRRRSYCIWVSLDILEALVHHTRPGDVIKDCRCRKGHAGSTA